MSAPLSLDLAAQCASLSVVKVPLISTHDVMVRALRLCLVAHDLCAPLSLADLASMRMGVTRETHVGSNDSCGTSAMAEGLRD